ncbi:hypothetical protein MBLNU230_g2623t1 [Neophaeotheca triangularis]
MAHHSTSSSTTTLLLLIALLSTLTTALRRSTGCNHPLPPTLHPGETGSSNPLQFTTSNGQHRTYLLHLPLNYSPLHSPGLIFAFHGKGKNASYMETLSEFSHPSINPDMLVVYPDGINHSWQGDPDSVTDDVSFTLELLGALESVVCFDLDSVFAAGKSNGGGFALNVLACDDRASRVLAAFAGVGGAYYQANSSVDGSCHGEDVVVDCRPARLPVPVLEAHGSADDVIHYQGGPRRGECLPSVPRFMTEWGVRDGVGAGNVSSEFDGGKVRRDVWGEGELEGVVQHWRFEGLGHDWPSERGLESRGRLEISPVIVEFFRRWSLDRTPDLDGMGEDGHGDEEGEDWVGDWDDDDDDDEGWVGDDHGDWDQDWDGEFDHDDEVTAL